MDKLINYAMMFQKNDYSKFDEFYEQTNRLVFFTIINIIKDQSLTEDLMQDTYMKFLKNIQTYDKSLNVAAYIATIARNTAINEFNKRKKETLFCLDDSPEIPDEENPNYELFEYLKVLDSLEKEIVVQHIVNNLKFKEISKILEKPLGTILWIYNKAIKKMKEEVKKDEKN